MTCHCELCSDAPWPTYTEKHRIECEARFVAALPTQLARTKHLQGVKERRGGAAMAILEAKAMEALDEENKRRYGA